MKVNIYVTEDVTDAERKEISQILGVKQASRDQLKEFLWRNGENWRAGLASSAGQTPQGEPLPGQTEELDALI